MDKNEALQAIVNQESDLDDYEMSNIDEQHNILSNCGYLTESAKFQNHSISGPVIEEPINLELLKKETSELKSRPLDMVSQQNIINNIQDHIDHSLISQFSSLKKDKNNESQ